MQTNVKRLLALVLVLVMVVSAIPASVLAAAKLQSDDGCTVSVLDSAPATRTVTVGSLDSLTLSEVFSDSESHDLTYSFESEVSNEHTKITDGVFYFTAEETGTFKVTLKATCSAGSTASHEITYTVEPASQGSDAQYGYDETPADSVTVYVTISNDGTPLQAADGTTLSHLEVTVPYFDLSLYGLEAYYRYQTEGGQGSYINQTVVERPTGLHLYIYLLERYYMGLEEDECCKGTSNVLSYTTNTSVYYMDGDLAYTSDSKSALLITGSATSLYMSNFWGHDENLMYYRNHCYPYMSPGWGATSDYILLSDGDTWDVAMFTNWNFYHSGYFACFDQDTYNVDTGATLTIKTQAWGTTAAATSFVAKNGLDVGLYDCNWNLVQTLSYDTEDGNTLTFTVPGTMGTYYLMAMDPNTRTEDAAIAPATAIVNVKGDPYANTLFTNAYYTDANNTDVQITQVTAMPSLNGTDGMGNEYVNLPAYQLNIPEEYVSTGLTVNIVFPTSQAIQPYALSYDADNGFGYSAPQLTVTDNGDDTQTVSIPVSTAFIGTNAYIVLEDGSYQGFMGFTFGQESSNSPIAVTGISLDASELNMTRWSTATLTATIEPEDAANKRVNWTSTDESVATVDIYGVVTAVTAGTATIKATTVDGGFIAECAVTVTDPDRPEQDEDGNYLIATARNLLWFAREVNSGNTAINAKLTASIDLSEVCSATLGSWTPIGDNSQSGTTYKGTFDGCEFTISNLYINEENSNYTSTSSYHRGLFGNCSGATIKNLTLKGTVTSNNRYVAALVGGAKGGTVIENCHNYATVTCSNKSNEWGYAGIVASLTASNVYNCSNHAMITGSCGWTGGIVGELSGGCTVSGCVNDAEVYCFNYTKSFTGVGGIVASARNCTEAVITNCYNTGKVWQYFQTMAYELHIGGILGNADATLTISNCYNRGEVTCSEKCLESAHMGAILGGVKSAVPTITNCYYLTDSCAAGTNDTVSVAMTDAEMKASGFAVKLGSAWQVNCPYPVQTWQEAVAHTDEDGDKYCDVCGAWMNTKPVLMEGVSATKEAYSILGYAYNLTELQYNQVFEDADGDSLNYTSYYYQRSTDGGETWGELTNFLPSAFGFTTIQFTETVAGTYMYRFCAWDGYEYSDDTYTLTLHVAEKVPFNFTFYVGKDYTGSYPELRLYKSAGTDANANDYVGWFLKDGVKVYVYDPAQYTIAGNAEDGWTADGYTLYDYEPVTFTNSAFDSTNTEATASGTVVNNYNMFYATTENGYYSVRAYAKNAETGEYDIYLGGQQLILPTETNVDGGTGGGTDIYLRQLSVYTTSKKTDNTYFTEDEYDIEIMMPIMESKVQHGTAYVKGNYTYYPFMIYAAGNAALFNIKATPLIDGYIFNQTINNTQTAGYTAVTKTITIKNAVQLTVTVPKTADFGLYYQWNNFNTTEIEPDSDFVNEDGETRTLVYQISSGNSNYTWRMTDPEGRYVTEAGWLKRYSANGEMTVTFDKTEQKSHDTSGLGTTVASRDEADIQVFLHSTGFMSTSTTYRVRAFRMWQLINSDTANIMVEPDFHVQVLQGNASDIKQVNGGNAEGNWIDVEPTATDIIAVTYDAIDMDTSNNTTHGGFFPATNPERTGVFVITNETAGTADAHVAYNRNSTATSRSDEWDYNYDTWFYMNTDEQPTLDFTVYNTTGDVKVSYAVVTTTSAMVSTLSSWTDLTADENGTYFADLLCFRTAGTKGGTVIIRMTDSTGTSYRLVRVAEMTITVTNATTPDEPLMPGDTVNITFSGLYRSVNKVAGIFNPTTYYLRYTSGETEVNGKLGQYQRMDNATISLTIPEDIELDEDGKALYTFTNGYVYGSMYSAADPFSTMYNMTDTGVGTNFNAVTVNFCLHRLADITIEVTERVTYDLEVEVTDGTAALEGTWFTLLDPEGNELTADENGIYQDLPYGDYSYTAGKAGYLCNTGVIHLGSADLESAVDGLLSKTVVMTKADSENPWDGKTLTEPEKVDGVYQIGTGAELAWFSALVNGTLESGTTNAAASAVLTEDIDLACYNWSPIGVNASKFSGNFDGQEHTIRNFYLGYTGTSTSLHVGLFGYVYGSNTTNTAEIKNFSLEGTMRVGSTSSSTTNAGAVVGTARYLTIENVHADVDITCTSAVNYVGGIAGRFLAGCTTTNCSNTGDISANTYAGGIIGYVGDDCGPITGCFNSGNITSAGNYAAGIVAYTKSNVISCYNTGVITSSGNGSYVAGLVGNANAVTVSNCFNAGKVNSTGTNVASAISAFSEATGTATAVYYLEGTASVGIYTVKDATVQVATEITAQTLASEDFVTTINTGLETPAFVAGGSHPILAWQSQQAAAPVYGDLSGDGEITSTDAALLYRYVNSKAELTEEQLAAADVNGDGVVNSTDAALIYRYVAGKITKFPAEG